MLENILIIQNDVAYQELWDLARLIACRQNSNQMPDLVQRRVVFRPYMIDNLEVISVPIVDEVGDRKVDLWMDITLGMFPHTEIIERSVKVGDNLTMAIYVKDSLNTTDIRVKDCYAYDNSKNAKNGLKPAQLQLSQSNGCPIREQLLGVWQRTQETMETGATMIAYTLLRAFKFPETDSVFLACNVDLCKDRCTDRCPLETQNRNDHQSSPPLDYEATIEDHSPPSMDYENSPAPYQPAQSSKAKSIKTASADYYSNEASPDESNSNELTSPDDNHPIKRQPSRDYVNHGLTEFQGADQSPENRKMKSKNVEIIVNHKKFPSTKSNGVDEVEPIDQNRIADQLYSLSQPIDTLLNSDPETANVESNTKEPDSQLNSLDESNRRARRLWFQKWPNFRNKVKTSSMMVRMNADIRLTNHQKTKAIAQLSGLTRPNLKIPSSSTPERKKRYT